MGKTLNYFFKTLEAQNLSNKKYHTALANGSTIASVNAILKDTSAINIRTVIAIIKWPIVYTIVLKIEPLLLLYTCFAELKIPEVSSVMKLI